MSKFFSSFLILLVLFSCKKELDEQRPIINVDSPTRFQAVNGIDTVRVTASISDNENIESVRVTLTNNNNIQVLSTLIETPNQTSFLFDEFYFFDDINYFFDHFF